MKVFHKCLHFDLKGLPPRPERMCELLELAAASGYNTIALEWEDMFPWRFDPAVRCETAYGENDIRAFCAKANELGLELIPLIQSLGHLEFVLSLDKYTHLREVPGYFDCLNPLADGARDLILTMIDEVLELMPGVRFFHMGGDEAWSFGRHPDTREYVARHGKAALYLKHITPIVAHLREQQIRPILWNDMMIDWDNAHLDRLAQQVDLCVWGYHQDATSRSKTHHAHISNIERLHARGFRLWGAPAYKGCEGPDTDLPDKAKRIANVLDWKKLAERLEMRGVMVTGWSRYSTHQMQISPIDACLDLLVASGRLLNGHSASKLDADVNGILQATGNDAIFNAAYTALKKFMHEKHEAWLNIIITREIMACRDSDPRRKDVAKLQKRRDFLLQNLNGMKTSLAELSMALERTVDPLWLSRYTYERVTPVEEEAGALQQRIAVLETNLQNGS